MRLHLADREADARVAGHRDDLEVRVPGDQPQQLAAGVAAGSRDRDPDPHPGSLPSRHAPPAGGSGSRSAAAGRSATTSLPWFMATVLLLSAQVCP